MFGTKCRPMLLCPCRNRGCPRPNNCVKPPRKNRSFAARWKSLALSYSRLTMVSGRPRLMNPWTVPRRPPTMFKELGQLTNLLRQAPRMKEEMEKLQQRLGQVTAEGDAGAGMVKIKVNGRMEVLACS